MAKTLCKGAIGIDEVGRGPLAGPVTVCAVYVENEKDLKNGVFNGNIRDSKKLTKHNRINIYKTIRQNGKLEANIIYAVSSRTAEHIDKYGISKSLQACVRSCIKSLAKQGIDIQNTLIRLDAGLAVPGTGFIQQSFIRGDEKYGEIALASILAKVRRDMYMERLARIHSGYGWDKNAGYGTLLHRKAIKKHGITKYHRKSFLKKILNY